MKALLLNYERGKVIDVREVEVPDDYNNDPYSGPDQLSFPVGSNQMIVTPDDKLWDNYKHEVLEYSKGPCRVVYDGPSRPLVRTGDDRLLTIGEIKSGGTALPYREEEGDAELLAQAVSVLEAAGITPKEMERRYRGLKQACILFLAWTEVQQDRGAYQYSPILKTAREEAERVLEAAADDEL